MAAAERGGERATVAAGRLELGVRRAAALGATQGQPARPALSPSEPRPQADPSPAVAHARSQPGGVTGSRPRAPQAGEPRCLHLRIPVSSLRVSVASALEGCIWGFQSFLTGQHGNPGMRSRICAARWSRPCPWVRGFRCVGSSPLCVCASTWPGVLCCVCKSIVSL